MTDGCSYGNLILLPLPLQSNTSVDVGLTGGEGAPITILATASVDVDVLFRKAKNLHEFKNSTRKENIMQGTKSKIRKICYWQESRRLFYNRGLNSFG